MRTVKFLTTICTLALFGSVAAQAEILTFEPTPKDLYDLDHYDYVTWGINCTPSVSEHIVGAVLLIDNINDHAVEKGDILYIHLLDNPAVGVKRYSDNQGGGDAFAGQGLLLTTYTDDDPKPNPAEDWAYTFTPSQIQTLNTYAADGRFGFGFDPDCHYYNDGVKLILETAPEPGMLLLAVGGLPLLVRGRRRAG